MICKPCRKQAKYNTHKPVFHGDTKECSFFSVKEFTTDNDYYNISSINKKTKYVTAGFSVLVGTIRNVKKPKTKKPIK